MEQLVDDKALAVLLKAKPQTLRHWRRSHQGPPFVRLGGLVRYRLSDVEAWVERQNAVEPPAVVVQTRTTGTDVA